MVGPIGTSTSVSSGRCLRGSALRSPMRAERAKPKSCKDDEIIAQGKRSAALGYGRKMIPSFFPSGFARQRRAKPEGKKEVGWGGSLPRAAASAALPWATILPPLAGLRRPRGNRETLRNGSLCGEPSAERCL